jgi:hypothetical protein
VRNKCLVGVESGDDVVCGAEVVNRSSLRFYVINARQNEGPWEHMAGGWRGQEERDEK